MIESAQTEKSAPNPAPSPRHASALKSSTRAAMRSGNIDPGNIDPACIIQRALFRDTRDQRVDLVRVAQSDHREARPFSRRREDLPVASAVGGVGAEEPEQDALAAHDPPQRFDIAVAYRLAAQRAPKIDPASNWTVARVIRGSDLGTTTGILARGSRCTPTSNPRLESVQVFACAIRIISRAISSGERMKSMHPLSIAVSGMSG